MLVARQAAHSPSRLSYVPVEWAVSFIASFGECWTVYKFSVQAFEEVEPNGEIVEVKS